MDFLSVDLIVLNLPIKSSSFVPAGSQKRLNRKIGLFLCPQDSNEGSGWVRPKGSIRWRLREVHGNGGTEPIPAGSPLGTSLKTIDLGSY